MGSCSQFTGYKFCIRFLSELYLDSSRISDNENFQKLVRNSHPDNIKRYVFSYFRKSWTFRCLSKFGCLNLEVPIKIRKYVEHYFTGPLTKPKMHLIQLLFILRNLHLIYLVVTHILFWLPVISKLPWRMILLMIPKLQKELM